MIAAAKVNGDMHTMANRSVIVDSDDERQNFKIPAMVLDGMKFAIGCI